MFRYTSDSFSSTEYIFRYTSDSFSSIAYNLCSILILKPVTYHLEAVSMMVEKYPANKTDGNINIYT